MNTANGRFENGSKVEYSCNFNQTGQNRGYVLSGDGGLTCNSSGSWTPQLPVCNKGISTFDQPLCFILISGYQMPNLSGFIDIQIFFLQLLVGKGYDQNAEPPKALYL